MQRRLGKKNMSLRGRILTYSRRKKLETKLNVYFFKKIVICLH